MRPVGLVEEEEREWKQRIFTVGRSGRKGLAWDKSGRQESRLRRTSVETVGGG